MRSLPTTLLLLSLIATASAGTIRVTVGNNGCRTKQLTVQRLWKAIPGMESVVIVPRKSGGPANQRVFVLTTKGKAPEQADLEQALGRRAERYPILAFNPAP